MKKFMLIIIGILFFLPGCLYAARIDGPYKGRVIDADTGKPIEGVVILGVWYREIPSAAGALHNYYDAMETVTDKNGEFEIKGQGLLVVSNVIPMDVLIFKAGYEYLGVAPWDSLKEGVFEKVKWEGDRAIIPLKKLTMEERKKSLGPPSPPSEASFEKVRLMLKEIDKDDVERGLPPRKIWKGHKIE